MGCPHGWFKTSVPKSRPSGKCSGKDDAEEHEGDYGAKISTLVSMGLLLWRTEPRVEIGVNRLQVGQVSGYRS